MAYREFLHGSVYAALRASTVVPVYNYVETGTEYPYVTYGEYNYLEDGDSCGDMWRITATVRIWTGDPNRGHIEALRIQDDISEVLTDLLEGVTDGNWVIVMAQLTDSFAEIESDGLTTQGVLTYELFLDRA